MTDDTGPYASAAWQYRQAGYAGIIPIGRGPAQKAPPPTGYTGWAGIDPSGPDVQAWIDGSQGARNIAWHLPRGAVAVDVDAYHRGAESLAKLEQKVGTPLPPTWTSTARGQSSVSRHHFYRATVPEGRTWQDHPGDGIDMLHVGHRYAMVWPSVHPDTGAEVTWYDPTGEAYEGVPEPGWFTELEPEWVTELTQEGVPLEGTGATDAQTAASLRRMRPGPPCPRVAAHLARELDRITAAAGGLGSLHEPGALYPLVAYGLEGHAGVREALSTHQGAYVRARTDSRGDAEAVGDADWWRQVKGAVGKRLHTAAGLAAECQCAVDPQETLPPEGQASEAVDPVEHLLSRMLDRDALDLIPPPRPLIRDVLDLDSESWIIGAPGGFKSFVALDWTGHVATGLPWRGNAVQQGRVVYVVAEGSKSITLRVRAWEETYGRRMADVLFLPEPVQVKDGETDKTGHPGREWRVLVEACRRLQPVLIVLDTQARITVGLEENSNTSMGVLVEAVRALKEATKACVLVVHHTGRNGEDARGASALDGAQDTEIRVDRPDGKRRLDLTADISTDKQKDGSEAGAWPVQMRIVPLGEHEGRKLSSLALEPWDPFAVREVPEPDWDANLTDNQTDIMAALRKVGDSERGATQVEVRQSTDEMRAERNAPRMSRTSFYRGRDSLAEKDLIIVDRARWYLPEHRED
jgi:AAA domain-containing protein/bifunctional DNA primase/polymerase-like protein